MDGMRMDARSIAGSISGRASYLPTPGSIGVDDLHEMCRDLDGAAAYSMDYATIERELDAILLPSVVVGIVSEVAGGMPVDYRCGVSFTNS